MVTSAFLQVAIYSKAQLETTLRRQKSGGLLPLCGMRTLAVFAGVYGRRTFATSVSLSADDFRITLRPVWPFAPASVHCVTTARCFNRLKFIFQAITKNWVWRASILLTASLGRPSAEGASRVEAPQGPGEGQCPLSRKFFSIFGLQIATFGALWGLFFWAGGI